MARSNLLLALLVLLISCGDGGSGSPTPPANPPANPPPSDGPKEYKVVEVKNGAAIQVKILYRGPVPNQMMPQSKDCHHPTGKLDNLVVAEDGGLKDVVIYLSDIWEGKGYGDYLQPVMDQIGCIYIPHVAFCRVGDEVLIKNSDSTLHNVHFVPKNNPEFNIGIQPGATSKYKPQNTDFIFTKCDIHDWMKSWLVVQRHPYYALTDADGSAKLTDIPPGTYNVRVKHLFFDSLRKPVFLKTEITIKEGEELKLELEFPDPTK